MFMKIALNKDIISSSIWVVSIFNNYLLGEPVMVPSSAKQITFYILTIKYLKYSPSAAVSLAYFNKAVVDTEVMTYCIPPGIATRCPVILVSLCDVIVNLM